MIIQRFSFSVSRLFSGNTKVATRLAMTDTPMPYDEIVALLERRLPELVPKAFRVKRLDGPQGWVIEKVKPAPGEWFNQEFAIWVTADAEWLTATYGNNDIGMGTPFQWSLTMATVNLRLPAGVPERSDRSEAAGVAVRPRRRRARGRRPPDPPRRHLGLTGTA